MFFFPKYFINIFLASVFEEKGLKLPSSNLAISTHCDSNKWRLSFTLQAVLRIMSYNKFRYGWEKDVCILCKSM